MSVGFFGSGFVLGGVCTKRIACHILPRINFLTASQRNAEKKCKIEPAQNLRQS